MSILDEQDDWVREMTRANGLLRGIALKVNPSVPPGKPFMGVETRAEHFLDVDEGGPFRVRERYGPMALLFHSQDELEVFKDRLYEAGVKPADENYTLGRLDGSR